MAAWKYYREERAKYLVEFSTKMTEAQLQPLCDFLSSEASKVGFNEVYHKEIPATPIKNVPIKVHPRMKAGWCFYIHAGHIKMSPNNMFWATVVHEWAHHAAWVLYKVAKNEVLKRYNEHLTSATARALGLFPKYRSHGPAHKEIMDWAIPVAKAWMAMNAAIDSEMKLAPGSTVLETVMYLKAAGGPVETLTVSLPSAVTPVVSSVPGAAVDAKAAFFASLPAMAVCPKCKVNLPKVDFGIRVICKSPMKLARQSYCANCR